MGKKNETTQEASAVMVVDRKELVNSTFTDSNALYTAIVARAGESHIEVKQDSSGNEYAEAVYSLKVAKGDRKEITVRNMDIATRIERVNRALATGDVSYFITAKEIEQFTDSDAVELGFDNVTSMCTSLFGLAKSTVENYRRLSRYFINDDFTIKGAIPKDTPISTLNQLLSLVKTENETGEADISNVELLFTSAIITPYMKQAEVKARLAKLKSMETDQELSSLNSEEIADVKQAIIDDSKERKENKGKKQEKQEKQEKQDNKVTVSDNIVVIAGEALNKVKELKELLIKLHIDVDMMSIEEAINVVIDENA